METGRAARIDLSLVLQRVRAGLLGVSLFSLHAGTYLLVTFSLFTWNLIADPTDLGVPAPRLIIPWGVLVLIHAAVVAVTTVLQDAFAPEEEHWVAPATHQVEPPAADPTNGTGVAGHQPPQRASRFRPATTSLEDVRNGQRGTHDTAWRRPVQSLRQAAAARRPGDTTRTDQDTWARGTEPTPALSEEERRAVGSQQLARWRGGRAPAENGKTAGRAEPNPSVDGESHDVQTSVVRPLTPDGAEFDDTDWRWLEAAATSHLARHEPDNDDQAEHKPESAANGTDASSPS